MFAHLVNYYGNWASLILCTTSQKPRRFGIRSRPSGKLFTKTLSFIILLRLQKLRSHP
jgi:hypothetical protein